MHGQIVRDRRRGEHENPAAPARGRGGAGNFPAHAGLRLASRHRRQENAILAVIALLHVLVIALIWEEIPPRAPRAPRRLAGHISFTSALSETIFPGLISHRGRPCGQLFEKL